MSRIDLSTTLWKNAYMMYVYVRVYKKCTIQINNYIKTKIVNWTYAFFPQDISDSQNSVRNSHHKTPSQLVAPVAFDSISQLPILAATWLGHKQPTTCLFYLWPLAQNHWKGHWMGWKTLESNRLLQGVGLTWVPWHVSWPPPLFDLLLPPEILENAKVDRLS